MKASFNGSGNFDQCILCSDSRLIWLSGRKIPMSISIASSH